MIQCRIMIAATSLTGPADFSSSPFISTQARRELAPLLQSRLRLAASSFNLDSGFQVPSAADGTRKPQVSIPKTTPGASNDLEPGRGALF